MAAAKTVELWWPLVSVARKGIVYKTEESSTRLTSPSSPRLGQTRIVFFFFFKSVNLCVREERGAVRQSPMPKEVVGSSSALRASF